jgi:type VI secretion system protein ImpF
LIDEAPERRHDAPVTASDAMDALRRSVRRDLEMLLNSRRRWHSWPVELRELDLSVLAYGIPDCTAGTFHDKRAREVLRAEVEDTLRRFEPRFARVRVLLVESKTTLDSTLRLQIDALLHADPAPEAITFETVVDATTADVMVRGSDG